MNQAAWKLAKQLVFLGVVAACQLFFLLPIAFHRLIARDEGFYLLAAKLVSQGKRLYHDFFFPQMPLTPCLYGRWLSLFGMEWRSARLFAAILTALIGALLYRRAAILFGRGYGLAAVILFCACAPVFSVYTTATTYAISILLLFLSYLALSGEYKGSAKYAAAGVLLALAVNARLMFAGVIPAYLLFIAVNERPMKATARAAFMFCAGLASVLLCALWWMWPSPDVYYFNNLGYHLLRSLAGPVETADHQFRVLALLLGFLKGIKYETFQLPLLIFSGIAALLVTCLRKKSVDAAFYVWPALFLVNFAPKPVYVQYFSVLAPFLIICSLQLFWQWLSARNRALATSGAAAAILLSFLYLHNIHKDIIKYTVTGKGVIGILNSRNALDWNVERVRELSALIDRHADGLPVVSFWPGYLVESGASPLPGTENPFGTIIAAQLNSPQKERYRVISSADISDLLRKGPAVLAVVHHRQTPEIVRKALLEGGYSQLERLDSVGIYMRTAPPGEDGPSTERQDAG